MEVFEVNESLVIEWLHRVLEEKIVDAKKIQDRILVLNHQIHHFKSMDVRYQEQVIEDLIKDIESYDLGTALKQLKDIKERFLK